MNVDEAKRLFIRQAHMEPINAEREAKRGTVDPILLQLHAG